MDSKEIQRIFKERDIEGAIKLLKDESIIIRQYAVVGLGMEKDIRAVEPLIQTLKKDKNGNVRRLAVLSLSVMDDVRVVEPITQALKDKDKAVQEAAKFALKELKKKKK